VTVSKVKRQSAPDGQHQSAAEERISNVQAPTNGSTTSMGLILPFSSENRNSAGPSPGKLGASQFPLYLPT